MTKKLGRPLLPVTARLTWLNIRIPYGQLEQLRTLATQQKSTVSIIGREFINQALKGVKTNG